MRPRPRFLLVTLRLITRSIWVHHAPRPGIPIQILHAINIVLLVLLRLVLVFLLLAILLLDLGFILIHSLRLLLRLIPVLNIILPPSNPISIFRTLDPLRAPRGILHRLFSVFRPVFRSSSTLTRTVRLLSPPLAGFDLGVRIQLFLQARTERIKLQLGDRAEDIRRRDGPFQRRLVGTDPSAHHTRTRPNP